MLIAKIRTSHAGWLYNQYVSIETKFVPREHFLLSISKNNMSSEDLLKYQTEHPDEPLYFYNRVETYPTKEADHNNLCCLLWGIKENGETEIIAFDTEGYILNENGKTIEKVI